MLVDSFQGKFITVPEQQRNSENCNLINQEPLLRSAETQVLEFFLQGRTGIYSFFTDFSDTMKMDKIL